MTRFMHDDCVVADGPGNDFGAWVPKTPGESGDVSVSAAPRGLVSQAHSPYAEDNRRSVTRARTPYRCHCPDWYEGEDCDHDD